MVAWGDELGIFGAGWAPTVVPKSDILPAQPLTLFASGQYNQSPVVLGTNRSEWGLFQLIGDSETVSSIAEFNGFVDTTYPAALAGPLKTLYEPASDAVANASLIQLLTDQVFRCPTRGLARLLQATGSPVWLYSFDYPPAFHAMELPYVFGKPNGLLAPELNETLRQAVQGYWTGFATQGVPGAEGLPQWPAYDAVSDQHMSLNDPTLAGQGLAQTTCDFWSSLNP